MAEHRKNRRESCRVEDVFPEICYPKNDRLWSRFTKCDPVADPCEINTGNLQLPLATEFPEQEEPEGVVVCNDPAEAECPGRFETVTNVFVPECSFTQLVEDKNNTDAIAAAKERLNTLARVFSYSQLVCRACNEPQEAVCPDPLTGSRFRRPEMGETKTFPAGEICAGLEGLVFVPDSESRFGLGNLPEGDYAYQIDELTYYQLTDGSNRGNSSGWTIVTESAAADDLYQRALDKVNEEALLELKLSLECVYCNRGWTLQCPSVSTDLGNTSFSTIGCDFTYRRVYNPDTGIWEGGLDSSNIPRNLDDEAVTLALGALVCVYCSTPKSETCPNAHEDEWSKVNLIPEVPPIGGENETFSVPECLFQQTFNGSSKGNITTGSLIPSDFASNTYTVNGLGGQSVIDGLNGQRDAYLESLTFCQYGSRLHYCPPDKWSGPIPTIPEDTASLNGIQYTSPGELILSSSPWNQTGSPSPRERWTGEMPEIAWPVNGWVVDPSFSSIPALEKDMVVETSQTTGKADATAAQLRADDAARDIGGIRLISGFYPGDGYDPDQTVVDNLGLSDTTGLCVWSNERVPAIDCPPITPDTLIGTGGTGGCGAGSLILDTGGYIRMGRSDFRSPDSLGVEWGTITSTKGKLQAQEQAVLIALANRGPCVMLPFDLAISQALGSYGSPKCKPPVCPPGNDFHIELRKKKKKLRCVKKIPSGSMCGQNVREPEDVEYRVQKGMIETQGPNSEKLCLGKGWAQVPELPGDYPVRIYLCLTLWSVSPLRLYKNESAHTFIEVGNGEDNNHPIWPAVKRISSTEWETCIHIGNLVYRYDEKVGYPDLSSGAGIQDIFSGGGGGSSGVQLPEATELGQFTVMSEQVYSGQFPGDADEGIMGVGTDFYIYFADLSTLRIPREEAFRDYDPELTDHKNWSMEFEVENGAIKQSVDPVFVNEPKSGSEFDRFDGVDGSPQTFYRMPLIRDRVAYASGGVYRENLMCVKLEGGSTKSIVELIEIA